MALRMADLDSPLVMAVPSCISFVQVNLARSLAASEELHNYCCNNGVDVAMICEPYTSFGRLGCLEDENIRVVKSATNDIGGIWAAVVIFNKDLHILNKPHVANQFFAVTSLALPGQSPVDIISGYFQYRKPTDVFTGHLLRQRGHLAQDVIAGFDANAFSTRWFHPSTNFKGEVVEDMIDELGWTILNKPGHPWTFQGARGCSNIDVTTSSTDISLRIRDWKTLEHVTTSDHTVISFHLDLAFTLTKCVTRSKYNDKKITARLPEVIDASLRAVEPFERMSLDSKACVISNAISNACKDCLPAPGRAKRLRPPWWNTEVSNSRLAMRTSRRTWLRTGSEGDRESYKHSRNVHVYNIRTAKKAVWRKLVTTTPSASEQWRGVTRWVIRGRRPSEIPSVMCYEDGSYTHDFKSTTELLLNTLIPNSVTDPAPESITHWAPCPEVSENELKRIVWRQKFKAPGRDGITARIVRASWPAVAHSLTSLVNDCLRECRFPQIWKQAYVRVLKKGPDKDLSLPKSYRPVSLLPVLGKIIEETISNRIDAETKGKLSQKQHGFMQGRSTTTAILSAKDWTNASHQKHALGIFLDISGAFDNVSWASLNKDMESLGLSGGLRRLILDYLTNRTATLEIGDSSSEARLTRRVPQGSKLGPKIWVLIMNNLLTIPLDDDTEFVAYADDLAVLVAGSTRRCIIEKAESTLKLVSEWANERGLVFSRQKSAALPLKGGLCPGFGIPFGDGHITTVKEVIYLGITIGINWDFNAQIENVLRSSQEMFSRLRSVRRSKWGLGTALALMLYRAVYIPRITYGVNIWFNYAETPQKVIKKLESSQRRPLLAISGAYRTTSTKALQVITGLMPIYLTLHLWSMIKSGINKTMALEDAVQKWETEWSTGSKGRWTYDLIPSIRERIRLPLSIGHYTSQLLTNHGDLNKRLAELGLKQDPTCSCGYEAEDAYHILTNCPNMEALRAPLERALQEENLNWPAQLSSLIGSGRIWEKFENFAINALKWKEEQRRLELNEA